jgi:hypothetical protein
MPEPSTSVEFLELVRSSELVSATRIDTCLKHGLRGKMPPTAQALAQAMVREGLLTHFQAEQILQGKWKRFSIGS